MAKLIFLIGMPGCGKSSLGKLLAEQTTCSFVDLDDYIVQEEGQEISYIFENRGENYFREVEASALRKITSESDEKTVISCGGGTPCFHDNMKLIKAEGFSIFLNVNKWILADRLIKKETSRPLLTGKTQMELVEWLGNTYFVRVSYYRQANMEIDAGTMTREEQLEVLLCLFD